MKQILKTLLWKWLFGKAPEPIRISKDHLPGLVAPKPAPFTPPSPISPAEKGTDAIDEMYQRFKKMNNGKPLKQRPPGRMDSM